MKLTSLALLGFATASQASATAQPLVPGHKAPEGSKETFDARLHMYAIDPDKMLKNVTKQSCHDDQYLVVNLTNSVLVDAKGRTGAIVKNYQFQFDGPPQFGSKFTGGFSICPNGSLALGASTVFYGCRSGHFENLYDTHWAEQCKPKSIVVMPCDEGGVSPSTSDKTQGPKDKSGAGSPGSSGKTPAGKDTSGGAKPAEGPAGAASPSFPVPICQIGDGQIQVHTKPCGSVPLAPPPAPPAPAPPAAPPAPKVSSAKAQVPSEAPKAAPAAAPAAPAPKPATVKPQAPPTTAVPVPRPVVQIGDGQIQVHSPAAAPRPAPAAPTAAPKAQAPTTQAVVTADAIRFLPATAAVLLVAALGTFLVL